MLPFPNRFSERATETLLSIVLAALCAIGERVGRDPEEYDSAEGCEIRLSCISGVCVYLDIESHSRDAVRMTQRTEAIEVMRRACDGSQSVRRYSITAELRGRCWTSYSAWAGT